MKRTIRNFRVRQSSEDRDDWILSFVDLLSLLLIYFIVSMTFTPPEKTVEDITNRELMSGVMSSIGSELDAEMKIRGDKVVVKFPNKNFFDSGEYLLNKEGVLHLKKFYQSLKNYSDKIKIKIYGLTDPQKVSKRTKRLVTGNWELRALRAISAMNLLIDEGFDKDFVIISSRSSKESTGEVKPNYKFMRKVEIEIEQR